MSTTNKSIAKIKNIFEAKKIKSTSLRLKITQSIFNSKKPRKAYEITELISDAKNKISPATVYRILNLLLEKHIIHKLQGWNSYIACHHPEREHHCMQAICFKCNNIEEFCDAEIEQQLATISQKLNFQSQREVIEIYGLCRACA